MRCYGRFSPSRHSDKLIYRAPSSAWCFSAQAKRTSQPSIGSSPHTHLLPQSLVINNPSRLHNSDLQKQLILKAPTVSAPDRLRNNPQPSPVCRSKTKLPTKSPRLIKRSVSMCSSCSLICALVADSVPQNATEDCCVLPVSYREPLVIRSPC